MNNQASNTYKFAVPSAILKKQTGSEALCEFFWNPRTKEFCGRDGASWAKVGCCYGIFYLLLGGFFLGMLGIFATCFMSLDHPTYYAESSVMNQAGMGLGFGFSLNPGLGFRPQIDPEDHQIIYNPKNYESHYSDENGFRQYSDNMRIFLEHKHPAITDKSKVIECKDGNNYKSQFEKGMSCAYDYTKVFKGTNCTLDQHFGYQSTKPCVLLKLNKIYSWEPTFFKNDEKKIMIKCEGENSVDQDNVKAIYYHSEDYLNTLKAGFIDSKYYPFMSQASYRQPFVMAQFDLTPNTLVNIICRAFAANIDNENVRLLRGMTKFAVYIQTV